MLYAATCLTPKQENSQVYHGFIWGLFSGHKILSS